MTGTGISTVAESGLHLPSPKPLSPRSGCGNTVNANHPATQQQILDSLRWWVEEYHVDGFRFDLGEAFSVWTAAAYSCSLVGRQEGRARPVGQKFCCALAVIRAFWAQQTSHQACPRSPPLPCPGPRPSMQRPACAATHRERSCPTRPSSEPSPRTRCCQRWAAGVGRFVIGVGCRNEQG